jgi:hypothetical protein
MAAADAMAGRWPWCQQRYKIISRAPVSCLADDQVTEQVRCLGAFIQPPPSSGLLMERGSALSNLNEVAFKYGIRGDHQRGDHQREEHQEAEYL